MRSVLVTALLVLSAACNERAPTSPTRPDGRVGGDSGIPIAPGGSHFISGPSFVFLGTTPEYRLSIQTGPDVNSRVLVEKAGWTTDDARVATVEPTGRLQTRGYGVTTLGATFQDRTFSRRVQVAPDVSGVWEGIARLTRCTGTFCDPRVCRNQFLSNATPTITLSLSQRETNVTGMFGSIPVAGHTRESGTLVLNGTRTTETSTSSIQNFAANLDGEFLRGGYTLISEGARFSFITCNIRERLEVDREFTELRRASR